MQTVMAITLLRRLCNTKDQPENHPHMDKQSGLNTTNLIEMPGLFPVSLIKRQVLILVDSLDPARGGAD